jgi:hypothetical protein
MPSPHFRPRGLPCVPESLHQGRTHTNSWPVRIHHYVSGCCATLPGGARRLRCASLPGGNGCG